eukprot:scaffold221432_cov41-Tisochrysis_lutea.AAC.3
MERLAPCTPLALVFDDAGAVRGRLFRLLLRTRGMLIGSPILASVFRNVRPTPSDEYAPHCSSSVPHS